MLRADNQVLRTNNQALLVEVQALRGQLTQILIENAARDEKFERERLVWARKEAQYEQTIRELRATIQQMQVKMEQQALEIEQLKKQRGWGVWTLLSACM